MTTGYAKRVSIEGYLRNEGELTNITSPTYLLASLYILLFN